MNYPNQKNGTTLQDLAGLAGGLIIGGLAGFGAMMLLAPQSGKETRAKIRQKSIELRERTMDTFDELAKLSQSDNRIIVVENRDLRENFLIPGLHYENR